MLKNCASRSQRYAKTLTLTGLMLVQEGYVACMKLCYQTKSIQQHVCIQSHRHLWWYKHIETLTANCQLLKEQWQSKQFSEFGALFLHFCMHTQRGFSPESNTYFEMSKFGTVGCAFRELADGTIPRSGNEVLLAISELVICVLVRDIHYHHKQFKVRMRSALRFCECSMATIRLHGWMRSLGLRANSNARSSTQCFNSKICIQLTQSYHVAIHVDESGLLHVAHVGGCSPERSVMGKSGLT